MSRTITEQRKSAIADAILADLSSDEGMKRFIDTLHDDPIFRKVSRNWDRQGFSKEAFAGSVLIAAIESGLRS